MTERQMRQQFLNSLALITTILQSFATNYRILGSANIVAHKNRIYRKMDDLDVLLSLKDCDRVFGQLKKYGFCVDKKRFIIFPWYEAKKENHLKITFFLIGDFGKDYFSYHFGPFQLRINYQYLQATPYSFKTINFIGIPLSSVIDGIRQTNLNPKRTLDKKILQKEIGKTKMVNGAIDIYIKEKKLPHLLYQTISFLGNLYGGIIERIKKTQYQLEN